MTEYKIATVKFNSGAGALLCSRCNVIIADGFEHEDRFHFCEQCLCEPFRSKQCLDEKPKREWVGLTKKEIDSISDRVRPDRLMTEEPTWHIRFAQALQRKLKEKNT